MSEHNDSRCIIPFLCWSGFGMLFVGETEKRCPEDLPPHPP